MPRFDKHFIEPDGWNIGELLQADESGYSDSDFPGCEYRLPVANGGYQIAVNIKITGHKSHWFGGLSNSLYRTRVQIEFVGDGEPSTFSNAWLYSALPLIEG